MIHPMIGIVANDAATVDKVDEMVVATVVVKDEIAEAIVAPSVVLLNVFQSVPMVLNIEPMIPPPKPPPPLLLPANALAPFMPAPTIPPPTPAPTAPPPTPAPK